MTREKEKRRLVARERTKESKRARRGHIERGEKERER
jgi:hypothetical protein